METYNRLLQEDNLRRAELEQHRKRFVNNVSHELKTPLAIISGQVEMLSIVQDAQKQKEYCDSVMEEIHRMNDLVTSMLQIFSVEEGLERVQIQRIELGEVVQAAYNDFSPLFGSRQIQPSLQRTQDCFINGNRENIRRAINNFLMNACRYTPQGGEVNVSIGLNGNYVLFSVYNDGEGIAEKDVERIWDSFYQGSTVGKENEEGTGLGLYIVKSIVSQHGGACGLENKEHGVEFWFAIPRIE